MNWDNLLERAAAENRYLAGIHQRFIDEHPEFIPGCECHKWTREARLILRMIPSRKSPQTPEGL